MTPPLPPLTVGLILPTLEDGVAGATPRWTSLRELAIAAEEVGFDAIWIYDHLLFREAPQDRPALRMQPGERGAWECWSIVAALAAATNRIRIGTFVLDTAVRSPALVAKMADTVDEISAGRLILGLGAGWNRAELGAFGVPSDRLVSRFEEAVQIVHQLLRTGSCDFDGTFYRVLDCRLRPRGPRPGGPPIMVGARSPRMLRAAARYADMWNAWARSPATAHALRPAVDAACRDVGRDPETLERTTGVLIDFRDLPDYRGTGHPPGLSGSDPDLPAILGSYAGAGIRHLQLSLDPIDVRTLQRLAPVIAALRAG
jgi:alkanesulfonate monooxygenase SsuD/methylene tetrahydromethanopterin reductase-like flavin-dependent oxidoreductase (luciferase family)